MSDKIIENNQVTVIGEVVSEFTYSHEVFGEGFYMMELLVKRLSNSCDRIPVMISERLIDVTKDCRGECIMVSGQFRSYNRHEELKNRLYLREKSSLLMKRRTGQRQTISCWKGICVNARCTGRHRWAEKSQIFYLR